MVGVRAVHGAGDEHYAALLGDQFGHAHGIKGIHTYWGVWPVLFNGADGEQGYIALFFCPAQHFRHRQTGPDVPVPEHRLRLAGWY